ncbi:MAG: GNAT family N-acetyltransferase [Acidobacteria bacterium]|nr:GNAT family N-acetyltransferase [Acidobacteriota bacterium]
MAEVFEEERQPLSLPYLGQLLARDDVWIIAAFADSQIIGGITAYTLPLTRTESSELFIYDLAVLPAHQRKGVGRRLVAALRDGVNAEGIAVAFVAADNEDLHALDFYRAIGGTASPVTIFTLEQP